MELIATALCVLTISAISLGLYNKQKIKNILNDAEPSKIVDLDDKKKLDTVLIAGASTTGLVTAINLSKIAKRVVLVDANSKPDTNKPIAYTKGCQPHVICKRSLDIIEELIPGFIGRLEKINEKQVEEGKNNQVFSPDRIDYNFLGLKFKECKDLRKEKVYFVSRGVLEHELRNSIENYKNIEIVYDNKLTSDNIVVERISGKQSKLTHVLIGSGSSTEKLKCDLFINCAGLGQRTLFSKIASDNGCLLPKTEVKPNISYKTAVFEFEDFAPRTDGQIDLLPGKSLVYQGIMHPSRIGYLAMPFDYKLLVMIDTYNNTKLDSVGEYTAKEDIVKLLPQELKLEMAEILKNASNHNVKIFNTYTKPTSELIDYSDLNCGGVFAVGDCVGSLNPVYGQGITMGISSSVILAQKLSKMLDEKGASGLTPEFSNQTMSEINDHYIIPWLLSTGSDMRYDYVHGKSLKMKVMGFACHWATMLFFKAANLDSSFTNRLLHVLYMENGYRKSLPTLGLHALVAIIKGKL